MANFTDQIPPFPSMQQPFPPFPPDGWYPYYQQLSPSQQSYDINTRILITALLSLIFVIALVVALHLYARYVLRRNPSSSWQTIFIARSVGGNHYQYPRSHTPGLDSDAIERIPKFAYKKRSSEEVLEEGEARGFGFDECSICLTVFEEGESVRVLPRCKHVFHVDCIDMWLHSHGTCPVCRASAEPMVLDEEDTSSREATIKDNEAVESSSSVTSRLSSSFRRMLSARESSGRRVHIEDQVGEMDLERQQQQQQQP